MTLMHAVQKTTRATSDPARFSIQPCFVNGASRFSRAEPTHIASLQLGLFDPPPSIGADPAMDVDGGVDLLSQSGKESLELIAQIMNRMSQKELTVYFTYHNGAICLDQFELTQRRTVMYWDAPCIMGASLRDLALDLISESLVSKGIDIASAYEDSYTQGLDEFFGKITFRRAVRRTSSDVIQSIDPRALFEHDVVASVDLLALNHAKSIFRCSRFDQVEFFMQRDKVESNALQSLKTTVTRLEKLTRKLRWTAVQVNDLSLYHINTWTQGVNHHIPSSHIEPLTRHFFACHDQFKPDESLDKGWGSVTHITIDFDSEDMDVRSTYLQEKVALRTLSKWTHNCASLD